MIFDLIYSVTSFGRTWCLLLHFRPENGDIIFFLNVANHSRGCMVRNPKDQGLKYSPQREPQGPIKVLCCPNISALRNSRDFTWLTMDLSSCYNVLRPVYSFSFPETWGCFYTNCGYPLYQKGKQRISKSSNKPALYLSAHINLLKTISTIQHFNSDRELAYLCLELTWKINGLL
jgi:hypothetical protein